MLLKAVVGIIIGGATIVGVFAISDAGKGCASTGSGSSPLVTILLMSNSCMILSGVASGGDSLFGFDAIFCYYCVLANMC